MGTPSGRTLVVRSSSKKGWLSTSAASHESLSSKLTCQTVFRNIYEQLAHQINRKRIFAGSKHLSNEYSSQELLITYLREIPLLNAGESVGSVTGVHLINLIWRGSAQHLDNLDGLVDVVLSGEEREAGEQFSNHTGSAPHIDCDCVVRSAKNELRSAVVAGADIGDVGLRWGEPLGTSKVADLNDVGTHINEDVLGLNVAMTNSQTVQIGQALEHLVCVELSVKNSGINPTFT